MTTHIVTIPEAFRDSFDVLTDWILADLQRREATRHQWDDTVTYRLPSGYHGSQVRVTTYTAVALTVMPDFNALRAIGIWFRKWDLVDPGDDIYALVRTALVRDYKAATAHR